MLAVVVCSLFLPLFKRILCLICAQAVDSKPPSKWVVTTFVDTMATSSQSSGTKKPMSPSEFFAKIYGTDRPTTSTAVTEQNAAQVVTHRPAQDSLLDPHRPPSWLDPPWSPEFWASAGSRSFYNPLALPPALTALSINSFQLEIIEKRLLVKFSSRKINALRIYFSV